MRKTLDTQQYAYLTEMCKYYFFIISKVDRIAQLICGIIVYLELVEINRT